MDLSRKYPDVDLCRTCFLCKSLHKCLAVDAIACPHAMTFGYSYFCQHPGRADFQQNTTLTGQPLTRDKSNR